MKFSKYELLNNITTTFGAAGTLAIMIGGASCIVGLSGTGLVKVGEFLSNHQPTLQRMMFYGSAAAGSGLFFVGVATAASRLRDEEGDREMEKIASAYATAVERRESAPVQVKQRTWAKWEEYEKAEKFCRGCQYYRGGGVCALHDEVRNGCGDRVEKASCMNCKYYTGEQRLPCAVHPLGLRENCSDWEPVENND